MRREILQRAYALLALGGIVLLKLIATSYKKLRIDQPFVVERAHTRLSFEYQAEIIRRGKTTF